MENKKQVNDFVFKSLCENIEQFNKSIELLNDNSKVKKQIDEKEKQIFDYIWRALNEEARLAIVEYALRGLREYIIMYKANVYDYADKLENVSMAKYYEEKIRFVKQLSSLLTMFHYESLQDIEELKDLFTEEIPEDEDNK